MPVPARKIGCSLLILELCSFTIKGRASTARDEIPPTSPQPYTARLDKTHRVVTLQTPYYEVRHDLRRGGAISEIRLTNGKAPNLLLSPMETRIRSEAEEPFSDLNDPHPKISLQQKGRIELVETTARLLDQAGRRSGIRVSTRFEYHWGYIKIHKQFERERSGTVFNAREICPIATVLAPSLGSCGYREGRNEREGAGAFSFGSCVWGKLGADSAGGVLSSRFVPRYFMFADPGVEGFEWFAGSDLAPWESPFGARGQGQFRLERAASGSAWFVAPYAGGTNAIPLPQSLAFDYYIGIPIKPAHAFKPWLHTSFNRNKGDWVSTGQVQAWKEQGIQTVHCHNDGDYNGDGLFWRDGSYPPYPPADMERYDKLIGDCHTAGLRVATYFSNKELHPSTAEFQSHGQEWGRKDAKGRLQHNFFRGTNEFGAQMCLRSGWLNFLEHSIDRVLKNHALDGVYYDWNVALYCENGLHEGKPARAPGSGHWDIDELLKLMEWTRERVGPKGLIIVHNTTTPMFATENFADDVVANEWGYGTWSEPGPALDQLPLEWSLVLAHPRGVISYGQIAADAGRRLHRLFALEALLSGVTPWPASPETFEIYKVLEPIGDLEQCKFADWRNDLATVEGPRCASAAYIKTREAWLLVGNLNPQAQRLRLKIQQDKIPFQITSAAVISPPPRIKTQDALLAGPAAGLDLEKLMSSGVDLEIGADSAVLVHLK